jgi:ubiquinone/menaquinone biosynthesis C-methylase UbiE
MQRPLAGTGQVSYRFRYFRNINSTKVLVAANLRGNLHDPSKPISEFARVLRNGGRLVILMLHPCFYNKHAERDQSTNGIIAASYFETRNVEQAFEVDGLTSPVANTAWFRPLEFYTERE